VTFRRSDNLAAIAMIEIREQHGTMAGYRRWQVLDVIRKAVAQIGPRIGAYWMEESEATQTLCRRLMLQSFR